MGFLVARVEAVSTYLAELTGHGARELVGSPERALLVVLDGVGGFQFGPLLARRALRKKGSDLATLLFHWQCWPPGEIWTDLMWLRRNRVMGARLARKLLALRRKHPGIVVHMLAFSGGAGIALFACESLRGRAVIETLVLAGPAVSPGYNLAPALGAATRCYALTSHRDTWILGLGTRIFGTTDRRFVDSAGQVGFRLPSGASKEELAAYGKLREIRWTPELIELGHRGGHTAWAGERFLGRHLEPMLAGTPRLPAHPVDPA